MSQPSSTSRLRGAWTREGNTIVLHDVPTPALRRDGSAIAAESVLVSVPLQFEPHTHIAHELVWVRGGTMTVHMGESLLTVPDGHGLWLPAGRRHAGRTTAHTTLHTAMFDPTQSSGCFEEPTVVAVSPLLSSLLMHLEREDLDQAARERAESVVFDILEPSHQQFSLTLPRNDRLDAIVSALVADPTDARSIVEWARMINVSERTVARLFRTHTGLSFLQWRQMLRVHHALSLLSAGGTVQDIADQMGYAQSSTFIAAFKRVFGITPGAYLAAPSPSAARIYP